MAKTVEYEGYIIQSTPQSDLDKWHLRIVISFENQQGARTREFSTEVLYATEHEADIHGTTFGQRIIDGKVEGQSVMDMKTPERRAMPRLRVQFRTTFSDSTTLEGTGVMLDLSVGGCRIESTIPVVPGFLLELRIHVPDLEWPLMIEAASVQWVAGQTFGLSFLRMTETEHKRLGEVILNLTEEGGRVV